MKRTKVNKTADAILTGDFHLREDIPVCRTEEFQQAQWNKIDFISQLQELHECPVLHSGDLFHHWKPSPWLLTKTMEHLPKRFLTIYGNHDLPQHNLELQEKCGIYNLWKAHKLEILPGTHWGTPVKAESIRIKDRSILIFHIMTYQGKKSWPGCTDTPGAGLLRKYPQFDLILTGHNHKPFVEEHKGKRLVNPGNPTRQTSDQAEHHPRVYLYYADDNTVEPVYLPITEGVVTREHIEKNEQRDERIQAFISKLNDDYETSLSFENNLEQFFAANQIRQSVKDIIYQSL